MTKEPDVTQSKLSDADFLAALRAVVGDAYVVTHGPDQDAFLTEPRGLWRGTALAVARPATTDEVSRVVALCAAHSRSVTPHGGGTGLVGGQIAHDARGVTLSLTRLNKVREIDPASNTMIV